MPVQAQKGVWEQSHDSDEYSFSKLIHVMICLTFLVVTLRSILHAKACVSLSDSLTESLVCPAVGVYLYTP